MTMKNTENSDGVRPGTGRLLGSGISGQLQDRLKELLSSLTRMESLNPPVIPYLAAWKGERRIIWYEFIGQRLCQLLDCEQDEAADRFRAAVIDRRVYRYCTDQEKVEEEIITREQLTGHRQGLREEVKQSGGVDAVYKVAAAEERIVWLKDQANIETFVQDNVCLSVGFLTDVTKEMEQKDLFEKIGYFDELTGLPKRLIMERIFEVNLGYLRRSHIEDFVFMMIDIDHFKAVNDTHGHQAGDFVLATLAELMIATKRKEDEIGRYGGEEFYGFSLGSVEHGLQFAERLRKKVAEHRFIYEETVIPVTISIGLASARQVDLPDQVQARAMVKLADARLYMAKRAGRNQSTWEGGC